ncbi:uncharacterized protein VTP21DRAFT_1306 [Calcarisporiella thermophila]|uniref:uncharacterized protein n=1 Tax=Calcarisporiella thermophila TaxID=911321 RepID=UPI003743C1F0
MIKTKRCCGESEFNHRFSKWGEASSQPRPPAHFSRFQDLGPSLVPPPGLPAPPRPATGLAWARPGEMDAPHVSRLARLPPALQIGGAADETVEDPPDCSGLSTASSLRLD